MSQKKNKVDIETQHANNTITSLHRSPFSDDKGVIGVDIKQRSRENIYTPAQNNDLDYK